LARKAIASPTNASTSGEGFEPAMVSRAAGTRAWINGSTCSTNQIAPLRFGR
jgi:hypothetical protein